MKRNIWINLLMACGLLLTLVNSVGAQTAASTSPSATDRTSTDGTSAPVPSNAEGLNTSPVNGPNGLDLKQTLDDFVADTDQPVGVDEIVSFLTDQAEPALQVGSFGPAAVFNPAATYFQIAAAKLTDSKFVVTYTDVGNSNYGTAIVGQVSGTSINWSNEYVFNPAATTYISVAVLTDSKFVVAYRDEGNSLYGTAIIGQVSGTSISYGSENVFNPAATESPSVAALSDTKFVVAYRDGGHSNYGTAIVGQAFDTAISYGFAYVFNAADTAYPSVAALSDSKFVVTYTDLGNSYHGTAIVGEVASYIISFGSEHVFNAATTYDGSVAALTDSTFVVAYQDGGNSNYGTAIVGEVSAGTTITWGNEYVFNPAVIKLFQSGGVARLSDTTFAVGYENEGDSDGRVMVGTVSGNTIFFGNQVSYNAGSNSSEVTVVALSPSKYVVAWDDESNGDYGTAKVGLVPTLGSAAVFNPAAIGWGIAAAKLTDTKFVVAFTDAGNSDYGTAIVGQVSGTTISYGSEYVFNPAVTGGKSVAALTDSSFVVAYQDMGNSSYGTAIVGQVSGTTISYGSEYVFNSAAAVDESVAALTDSKFVVAYRDDGNSLYGTAIVGQVSGTTISYGSETVFNAAVTDYPSVAALTNTKFVVAYRDTGNSFRGTAIVGQVSGTAISYGAEYAFNWISTDYGSVVTLSDSTFVVVYQKGGSGYGTAIVGQVSGTAISYGSETVFNAALTWPFHSGGVARLSSTTFVVGFVNDNISDLDGRVIVGTVSGNTITFGHQVSFKAGSDSSRVTVVGLSPKFIVAWRDLSNSDYGTSKLGMISTHGGRVYLPLILRN